MGAPSRRGPPAGSLEAFGKLMESLPTGTGPGRTQRREQVWAQIGGNGGAATSAAMLAGLQYVQELERALPAGSRPLVMHSFQTAMSVASELLQTGMELAAEHFRLILLAMRKYLELYAHLAGPQHTCFNAFGRKYPDAVNLMGLAQRLGNDLVTLVQGALLYPHQRHNPEVIVEPGVDDQSL